MNFGENGIFLYHHGSEIILYTNLGSKARKIKSLQIFFYFFSSFWHGANWILFLGIIPFYIIYSSFILKNRRQIQI